MQRARNKRKKKRNIQGEEEEGCWEEVRRRELIQNK